MEHTSLEKTSPDWLVFIKSSHVCAVWLHISHYINPPAQQESTMRLFWAGSVCVCGTVEDLLWRKGHQNWQQVFVLIRLSWIGSFVFISRERSPKNKQFCQYLLTLYAVPKPHYRGTYSTRWICEEYPLFYALSTFVIVHEIIFLIFPSHKWMNQSSESDLLNESVWKSWIWFAKLIWMICSWMNVVINSIIWLIAQ